jgi:hypothetical protein
MIRTSVIIQGVLIRNNVLVISLEIIADTGWFDGYTARYRSPGITLRGNDYLHDSVFWT